MDPTWRPRKQFEVVGSSPEVFLC